MDLFGEADVDKIGALYIEGIDRLNRAIYKQFPRIGKGDSEGMF